MFWVFLLGFAYLLALAVLLIFFAGAAKVNERWDHSHDADRRKHENAA